jgi:hypothetical protein
MTPRGVRDQDEQIQVHVAFHLMPSTVPCDCLGVQKPELVQASAGIASFGVVVFVESQTTAGTLVRSPWMANASPPAAWIARTVSSAAALVASLW